MDRLKKRRDFLRLARACKSVMPGFVLQARRRRSDGPFRVGFTATKKIGNAVMRNRARRLLREAARLTLPKRARKDFDYVLVARKSTLKRNFHDIALDLEHALSEVHGKGCKQTGKEWNEATA